jgi:hypothetical protein
VWPGSQRDIVIPWNNFVIKGLGLLDTIRHALVSLPEVPAQELAAAPPLDDALITEETVYAWLGSQSVGNRSIGEVTPVLS